MQYPCTANTLSRSSTFFLHGFHHIRHDIAFSSTSQFGEGWLIAGEMSSFASQGINHVISLQPFGCIANHIVEKGIEKRIKSVYPQINILSLDFDSSVSDVNITNRLLLFVDNIK